MRWLSLSFISIFLISGCGGSNTAPVSGVITLDGKPLAKATIMFMPDSKSKDPGPPSVAVTDAQGKYTLALSNGAGSGAVIGKHKVTITSYEGDGDESSDPNKLSPFRKPIIPDIYNVQSKLTFDVPSGGSSAANFDLNSKGK